MIRIQKEPIDPETLISRVYSDRAGAVVTFDGRIRNHSDGREVTHLHYDVYPGMAEKEMEKLRDQAAERWSLESILVVHRVGRVEVGESSVFIAVSAAHRDEAFAACRFLIDQLKETVPIWKQEHFKDGKVWVE